MISELETLYITSPSLSYPLTTQSQHSVNGILFDGRMFIKLASWIHKDKESIQISFYVCPELKTSTVTPQSLRKFSKTVKIDEILHI